MKALSHPKILANGQISPQISGNTRHFVLKLYIVVVPPQKTSGKKTGPLISGGREETGTCGQNIDRCSKFVEEICFAEVSRLIEHWYGAH